MVEIEQRVKAWVDAQDASVAAIGLDEIRERAAALAMEPTDLRLAVDGPGRRRGLSPQVMMAAAVIMVVALAVGWYVFAADEQSQPVATDPGQPESRVERLLALVPDDSGGLPSVVDIEAIREASGIERPSLGAPVEEYDEFLMSLHSGNFLGSALQGIRRGSSSERGGSDLFYPFRERLGIEMAHFLGVVEWGQPPAITSVIQGTFDSAEIDRAARNLGGDFAGEMAVREHRGVTYYAWFEDDELGIDPSRTGGVDSLGRGHRVAVIDDLFIYALTNASMETAIGRILDGERGSAAELATARAVRPSPGRVMQLFPAGGLEAGGWVDMRRTADTDGIDPLGPPVLQNVTGSSFLVASSGEPEALLAEIEGLVAQLAEREAWPDEWISRVKPELVGGVVSTSLTADEVTSEPVSSDLFPEPVPILVMLSEALLQELIGGSTVQPSG